MFVYIHFVFFAKKAQTARERERERGGEGKEKERETPLSHRDKKSTPFFCQIELEKNKGGSESKRESEIKIERVLF